MSKKDLPLEVVIDEISLTLFVYLNRTDIAFTDMLAVLRYAEASRIKKITIVYGDEPLFDMIKDY